MSTWTCYPEEDVYKKRGRALIINNRGGDFKMGGARVMCLQSQFIVDKDQDDKPVTADEMLARVEAVSKAEKENKENCCFLFIFAGYGGDGYVYGSDGKPLALDQLAKPLLGNNCPELAGKPKIFVIDTVTPSIRSDGDEETYRYYLPTDSDFFFLVSHLKPQKDRSPFLDALVKSENICLDLAKLGQKLRKELKEESQKCGNDKVYPYTCSTLRGPFSLAKKRQ